MPIPKIIHYCWVGGKPLPPSAEKCIASWKKYAPGWEIRRWDESNIDLSSNRYAREALEQGKWAFVSDWVRLKSVYDFGGVYFDTDVELIRPLDTLLEGYEGFFGSEDNEHIATGLGFGAPAGAPLLKALLDSYDDVPFVLEDGSLDLLPCPKRNAPVFEALGIRCSEQEQVFGGIRFLPKEYLCPMDYFTGKIVITDKTVSIHHYDATWCSDVSRRTTRLKRLIGTKAYTILYAKLLHHSTRWEW